MERGDGRKLLGESRRVEESHAKLGRSIDVDTLAPTGVLDERLGVLRSFRGLHRWLRERSGESALDSDSVLRDVKADGEYARERKDE